MNPRIGLYVQRPRSVPESTHVTLPEAGAVGTGPDAPPMSFGVADSCARLKAAPVAARPSLASTSITTAVPWAVVAASATGSGTAVTVAEAVRVTVAPAEVVAVAVAVLTMDPACTSAAVAEYRAVAVTT